MTVESLDGKTVVASISGGKDSAAMGLWLQEQGIPHRRIFLDTGWEHPDTYDYLRGPLTAKLGPIEELRAPLGMADLIRKRGMFPSRVTRFCTQELKVFPSRAYIRALISDGHEVVNAVGIRGSESEARSKLFEWDYEPEYGCQIWRPLLSWSEQDVIDIHKKHGLPPNPLYLQGAKRVGCWPCINVSKDELKFLGRVDPGRVDMLRALEAEVATAAEERWRQQREQWSSAPDPEPEPGTKQHERWEKKKARLEAPFSPPAYFQARLAEDGKWPCWPIDKVMAWARTSHGGRQLEMFHDDHADGCFRWGLCDRDA